jgi:pantothenate kinase type III
MTTPSNAHPTLLAGAVDIGNTRLKILAGGHYFVAALDDAWQDQVQKFFWTFSGKTLALGVSSVNPEAEALFAQELRKRSNIKAQPLAPMIQSQRFVDMSGIQGMGSDRVLGLIGALHYDLAAIRPIVTIDCGTAITINAMTVQRKCLGGAIMPGIRTQLRALHEFTEQLPHVEPAPEEALLGTHTAQAMLVGAVHGAAGAVLHIVQRLIGREFQDTEPMVFVTGGDATLLLSALQTHAQAHAQAYTQTPATPSIRPIHEQNLVLRGIEAMMAQSMTDFMTNVGSTRLGG